MIARIYRWFPGPPLLRAVLFTLAVLVTLALLGLFYEWVGSSFLDTGGQIG